MRKRPTWVAIEEAVGMLDAAFRKARLKPPVLLLDSLADGQKLVHLSPGRGGDPTVTSESMGFGYVNGLLVKWPTK